MFKYDETTILVADTLRDLYREMPKILKLCDDKLNAMWRWKHVYNFVVKTDYRYLYWKGHLEITKVDVSNIPLRISDFQLNLKRNPFCIELLHLDMVNLKYVYINNSTEELDYYVRIYPELSYHILRIKSELDNNILDLDMYNEI